MADGTQEKGETNNQFPSLGRFTYRAASAALWGTSARQRGARIAQSESAWMRMIVIL
ncbi:hypothetical protein [Paracidovorax valerianellae]|uniref:hypothetical protein n=1 Tax=Paracidovorax valerianellae TaxID=187868 RepID=UPI00230413C3|nr:hypothetical protein [Paracidovorax valerianellae]MDA8446055.1 hypothetical protein [Paracidovorax valerianellae]